MSNAVLNRTDAFSSILGGNRSNTRQIALDDILIGPAQPRVHFDPVALNELTESIRQHGVLQPILVRERGQKYELIAGERRFRAAKDAGLAAIPALIKDFSDDEAVEIALLENLNREDLNPLEETDGILKLLGSKLKVNREQVVERLRTAYYLQRGRTVTTHVDTAEIEVIKQTFLTLGRLNITSFYNHRLPLLDLPEDLLERVRSGELEYPKATALGRVKDQAKRGDLTRHVIENNLSLEQTLKEIQGLKQTGPSPIQNDILQVTKKLLSPTRFKKLDATKRRKVEKLLGELQDLMK
jgi:ParB family transcriptional regulator, chromosome partitioning protein